ncbi:unnamed protein product [Cladocopium goreaui]|uniref:Uncharacterized protein n=1 Tax=Cladocopium goreaui TaxID=2562237 RepID=A0A9P1DT76_9DINO|nr:unnamed protein product [Cladocopium goreaui]
MADAADAADAAEIHCPSEAVGAAGVEDSQPASGDGDPVVAVPDSPEGLGEQPVVDSQIPESFDDSQPVDMPATPASDHGQGDAVLKLLRAVKMKLNQAHHAAAIRGIAATAPPGKPDASVPAAAPATCPAGGSKDPCPDDMPTLEMDSGNITDAIAKAEQANLEQMSKEVPEAAGDGGIKEFLRTQQLSLSKAKARKAKGDENSEEEDEDEKDDDQEEDEEEEKPRKKKPRGKAKTKAKAKARPKAKAKATQSSKGSSKPSKPGHSKPDVEVVADSETEPEEPDAEKVKVKMHKRKKPDASQPEAEDVETEKKKGKTKEKVEKTEKNEKKAKKEKKMTEKEAKQEGKSTFAKRAPTASSWDKWHAIRDSYNSFVRDKVDHHTYVEDYWWHYCKEILANNGGKLKALKEKVLYDFLCLEHVCACMNSTGSAYIQSFSPATAEPVTKKKKVQMLANLGFRPGHKPPALRRRREGLPRPEYRFVEHYAGQAEMTKAASKEFGASAGLDKLYHRSMDEFFAQLGYQYVAERQCGRFFDRLVGRSFDVSRTYTKAFAFHMTRILKHKRIDPKPSSADPAQQLLNLWHQSEGLGDRWVDAGLPGLADYVLGARGLKVPSPAPATVLRHSRSEETLLPGIYAMDVQAVKNELPDDPAELLKLHEELSRMAPKHSMLIRGISDATTIPATAEELAQLRASLPATPSPSLDEKGETRKFQKPTACKGSAPAPPANGVSTVATPCVSRRPTPKVPPVPMQELRAPAPRTPEGEAPSKKPRVDTNQRIARLLGPSQAPSAKACPPTVSPTSVARSLAAELDDVSLSNEPVARESSLVFPKGVEHEGGECLAAFMLSAAPGSPDTQDAKYQELLAVIEKQQVPGAKRSEAAVPEETRTPPAPAPPVSAGTKPMSVQETSGDEAEYPVVMHGATMNRNEKQKVARVCTPKGSSGHLEVPNDIFKLWNTKAGKEKLYALWAKSGGVKAVFLERVTILSSTTRSKKLQVTGGFYSEEDMKKELNYKEDRIEKIKKWAISKKLVRLCEYDEDTPEYWVNTRTSGTLSREDVETMSRERTHDQTVGADSFALGDGPEDTEGAGGFNADLGASGMDLEGDSQVTAQSKLGSYLKNALKTKNYKKLNSIIKSIDLHYETRHFVTKAKKYRRSKTEAPAKECVEAAIAARKKDSCRVLAKIASAKLDSADEPLFEALKACGLALNGQEQTLSISSPCLVEE